MLTQIFEDTPSAATSPELLAEIRMTPQELTRRHAIEWQVGKDELDAFLYAAVRTGAKSPPFKLLSYVSDPDEGLLVLGPVGAVSEADLTTLVDSLGASPDQVMGRRSEHSYAQGVPHKEVQAALDRERIVFDGHVQREIRTVAYRPTRAWALTLAILAGLAAAAAVWPQMWEPFALLALVLVAFAVTMPRLTGRVRFGGSPPIVEGEFERRRSKPPPGPATARAKESDVG